MTYSTHVRIAALMTAGFLTAVGTTAYADTVTSGNGSILGGNQADVDLDVPVNVCGNAIAVLGVAGAQCSASGAEVSEEDSETATSGNGSLLGGNQLDVDGDVPVNLCGNAVGVAGVAGADCTDSGAGTGGGSDDPTEESDDHDDEERTEGDPGEQISGGGELPGEGGVPGGAHGDEGNAPGGNGGGAAEEAGSEADEGASPSSLAQTGTDGGALIGLLAGAAAAVAAGIGFLMFGRRRRASA